MRQLVYIVLAVLAAAGCAAPAEDDAMTGPTITIQEADAQVERYLREVAAAIPGASLEPLSPPLTVPCGGVVGGPEDGTEYASRSYEVRDVPTEEIPAAIDAAIDYWSSNGYTVSAESREQGIVRASAPDGTVLTLQNATEGYLTIVARSPCVWPEGTPPA